MKVKPSVPEPKSKKEPKVRGKSVTAEQYEKARELVPQVALEFFGLLDAKLARKGLAVSDEIINRQNINEWFGPLLAHQRNCSGDVVNNVDTVTFVDLYEFLACQINHTSMYERRLDCWTNMYAKGIVNKDADWTAQHARETKKEAVAA